MTALREAIEHTALGWVKPELDETLRQAKLELEAYVEDPADPSHMRFCASFLHQVQGTLRMVELYAPAMVAEEMELLAQALQEGRAADRDAACAALMRGVVLLPDYLERLQSGHKDIPIVLLPLLNELRAARNEGGLSESVLFAPDLERPLPASVPLAVASGGPSRHDEAMPRLARLREALGQWNDPAALPPAALAEAVDALLPHVQPLPTRRMLWVSSRVLQAMADGALPPSPALREVFGGVEREARRAFEDGFGMPRTESALEPTRQLLYQVAHHDGDHPALAELRQTFDLSVEAPSESELDHARGSLSGRNRALLDTVSAAVKEDLLRVKDALDLHLRTGADDVSALHPQIEALGRVADTLGMLGLGVARNVVQQQRDAMQAIVNRDLPADENALLDVAGALLYVDATLDDQVARLGGGDAPGGEQDDLFAGEAHKVVETIVREAIANFSDARQALVAFVETSWSHDELAEVPRLLQEVSGALRMMELQLPADYVAGVERYARNELIARRRVPNGRQLDTLADALASLEYYLEALSEQRANRNEILDITRNSLESLGYWPLPEIAPVRTEAATPVLPEAPALAAIADAGAAAEPAAAEAPPLDDVRAADPADAAPAPTGGAAQPAAPEEAVEPSAPVARRALGTGAGGFENTGDDIDDEIREVFLEEFAEEIDNLDRLLPVWRAHPEEMERLRPIRRVFHTLKGSGRLVGARMLGEFSWKIENMLNRVLDGSRPASPAVVAMVDQAFYTLPELLSALRGSAGVASNLEGMQAEADRIAGGDEAMPAAPAPNAQGAAVAMAVDTVPAKVDALLLEILDAEVTGHLGTVDAWLAGARGGDARGTDALLRALHTMNGAFAMTEVPVVNAFLGPSESYARRLLAAGTPATAEGVAAIAELVDAVRATVTALHAPAPALPVRDALAARLSALRDSLPEALPEPMFDLDDADAASEADAGIGLGFDPAAGLTTDDLSAYADLVDGDAGVAQDVDSAVAADGPVPVDPQAGSADEADRTRPEGSGPGTTEAEGLDAGAVEAERLEAERLERERVAAEQPEIERLEAERLEAERLEAERLEAERLEAERLEAERVETERLEAERLEVERLEAERAEADRLEADRLEAEQPGAAGAGMEQREADGVAPGASEGVEADTALEAVDTERRELDRLEAELLERERRDAEAAEAERLEAERLEAERAEAERVEAERAEAERLEAERLEAERLEAERIEAERIEAERVEAERLEAERLEAERIEAERIEAERIEAERIEAERIEAERIEAERAEAERAEAERAEAERVEAERVEAERVEAGRLEAERADADRMEADAEALAVEDVVESLLAAAAAPEDPDEALDVTGLDTELLDIFVEESSDLLDHSDGLVAQLRAAPGEREPLVGLQRDLHTIKGGARMAGMFAIGELGHAMETLLEAVVEQRVELDRAGVALFERGIDRLHRMVTRVGDRQAVAMPDALIEDFNALAAGRQPQSVAASNEAPAPKVPLAPLSRPIDDAAEEEEVGVRAPQEQVRIRADLLDRLVNYAGEVAIYRARLEQQLGAFRAAMNEMEQTNARLRDQLRRLDIETEAQIIARYQREHDTSDTTFDPLELDRFSTLQQLSRALGESAADMSSLQGTLDDLTRQYETLLLQQSRVSSELQEGLMRTRMVPFDALVPRLRRVVRQAASDTGKQVQLRLDGAQGELDRNVLERMTAPLEHMLRNAVAHGVEAPAARRKSGKPEEGTIHIAVRREGSEVVLEVGDDGAGLDRAAIRKRAEERGLIRPGATLGDSDLDLMIFEPGFSTAAEVSRLAGRGVGMDVVASEVRQLGGSLDIATRARQGTTFTLRLPQTLAVTQAVFVRIGDTSFAVPIASVRGVGRVARERFSVVGASYEYGGEQYLLHDLGELVGQPPAKAEGQLQMPVLLVRSGDLRVAVAVDEILGNREIVVKPVGPQVASIPGIFGATIMGDGSVVVILDVAPLARRHAVMPRDEAPQPQPEQRRVPLVMVVDDSVTMRKVTGRVLERHKFEVVTAKDGVDALERLDERVPDLMLLDIEMPRMDGYELATQMKADPRLRNVLIMMITSRTGEKHRQRAFDIGVDRYLGKPYQENELIRNVYELLKVVPEDE
jgi:chemosensory pili system protein ChpA (sensor histidine kinase/response regulator)